jgi:hypothetical protein
MIGSRDNARSRPADDRAGHTTRRSGDGAAPENGGAQAPLIKLHCPNPACGKVLTAQARLAGKKGRCPDCGAALSVPNVPAPPTEDLTAPAAKQPRPKGVRRTADTDGDAQPREGLTRRDAAEVREVRAGCIGRGHAGKTVLFRALGEGLVGDFFPSGLHVEVGDPREVARMIREGDETQRALRTSGLPPTLQASRIRYVLCDGDEQRVVYEMREVIGQVLTDTLPDSAAGQQTHYDEYLKSLADTDVLWAMVPCPPPDPGARDRRRYANDLRLTLAYLREALRLRSPGRPVAVAVVLSKVDTLFEDAEEARASLTDDVLQRALGPLAHLVEKSARVSDAAIIPVTAFGFGNAVLRAEAAGREGAPPGSADEPLAEPVWLLRAGVALRPFNLDALFIWTLLVGLLNRAGHAFEGGPEVGEVCRMLREDLDAADPWLLPLKGGVAGEGRRAPGRKGARQA